MDKVRPETQSEHTPVCPNRELASPLTVRLLNPARRRDPVLTDRGSEYCGNPERHEYELYLAVEDIDHSRTKTKSPQTNGICERFHMPT